ncbi:MAG: flagellin, partial [Myxococcota bacterium]
MGLTVNTNVAALNSISNLNMTQNHLSKSLARISSGVRITTAADDAAGLGVAENLAAQTRSLKMAQRN